MESDWDHVTVLRKKAPTAKEIRNESTLNAARRAGAVIAIAAGHNKTGHSTDLNVARLDRETDELEHKRVPAEVGRAIIKARTEKGWNQKELAVKINEKPQVVQEYEGSKAIPNQQILAKFERILGVKLRGKDIGQPLAPRGKASAAK